MRGLGQGVEFVDFVFCWPHRRGQFPEGLLSLERDVLVDVHDGKDDAQPWRVVCVQGDVQT